MTGFVVSQYKNPCIHSFTKNQKRSLKRSGKSHSKSRKTHQRFNIVFAHEYIQQPYLVKSLVNENFTNEE